MKSKRLDQLAEVFSRQDMLGSLHLPLMLLDADQRILSCNSYLRRCIGKTRARGKQCWEIMNPTHRTPEECCPLIKARKSGQPETASVDCHVLSDSFSFLCSPIKGKNRPIGYLNIGIPVTVDAGEQPDLEQLLNFQQVVAGISADFINLPTERADRGIQRALQSIGTTAGVVCAVLFQFSTEDGMAHNTNSWYADSADEQADIFHHIPLEAFAHLFGLLQQGQVINIGRPEDLPVEAIQEKKWISDFWFRPFLVVPMLRQGVLYGGLVLGGRVGGRWKWNEQHLTLLQFCADIFSNLLERKRADDERLALEHRSLQAQKMESLGVLASGVAHDLNNMLVGMLGNAELARLEKLDPVALEQRLRGVELAAQRAADLVKQLLAYAGRGNFCMEPVDLNRPVREMTDLLRVAIPKKAELHLDLADNLPAVQADMTQMRQVIMNLVTNAAESLSDESGSIRIRTDVIASGTDFMTGWNPEIDLDSNSHVLLEVADTGCGLDERIQDRIFEPFFSTKLSGRGLGLSAVSGIVRSHHGSVKIESKLGEGTVFRILFPAVAASANQAEAESPAVAHRFLEGQTVLLVDDESTVRTIGQAMLQRLGFKVVLAKDGQEAVEIFSDQPDRFACVLLDLKMPRMDGWECYRHLKKMRSDLPIVFVSGLVDLDQKIEGLEPDEILFIQKPFTSASLVEKIWKALSNR